MSCVMKSSLPGSGDMLHHASLLLIKRKIPNEKVKYVSTIGHCTFYLQYHDTLNSRMLDLCLLLKD